MRNKTHLWKRSLAAFLSFVMLMGMFPALGGRVAVEVEAAPKDSEDNELPAESYITLPITIRDFAADGMLFEYNEVNRSTFVLYDEDDNPYLNVDAQGNLVSIPNRVTVSTDIAAYSCVENPSYWDRNSTDGSTSANPDYTGIRVYDYTNDEWEVFYGSDANQTGEWWHCLILDAYGNILASLPYNVNKNDDGDYDFNQLRENLGGAYSVWAWIDDTTGGYDLISGITEDNKIAYKIGLNDSDDDGVLDQLYVGNRVRSSTSWNLGTTETPDYKGIRYFDTTTYVPTFDATNTGLYWHCVICDADGYVVDVIPAGEAKVDSTYTAGPYYDSLPSGGFSLWVWSDDTNRFVYNKLAAIKDENRACYQVKFVDCDDVGTSILYLDEIKTFHEADTQAFGLLQTDINDYINNLADTTGEMSTIIGGSVLFANGSWNSTSEPTAVTSNLYSSTDRKNPYATQQIHGARVRTNLVDMMLDEEYKPIYTPETVTFLAEFMQKIMAVPEQNADGSYNTFHVGGIKLFDEYGGYWGPNAPDSGYDLADMIRKAVKGDFITDENELEAFTPGQLGDYTESRDKFTSGGLRTFIEIRTWFDAAYFLLHNTWRDSGMESFLGRQGQDGYGWAISRYDRIHLVETTNEAGEKCYVFNARYDDSVYDWSNGEIYNTQFTEYTQASNRAGNLAYAYGNKLPVSRFDPLGPSALGVEIQQGLGYGMSGNTYGDMTGASETQDWDEYYDETNYNMTLEGHAQFTYHHDSNQYFTFTGDDDVYLYINGVRVLDIGGAHSISKVSINLNDVAEVCDLEDGGTYRFDFFFMERHGTAANFGIETNIQVVDPSMTTHKTGYQNGVSTGYNGYVDPEVPVVYDFSIENKSDVLLHDLTFDDAMIGVSLNKDKITLNSETKITDLSVTHYDANGVVDEFIAVGDLTDAKLQAMLKTGLKGGEQIVIYGFTYTIPADKWQHRENSEGIRISNDYFYNLLSTTAKDSLDKEVIGTDHWVVQKMDFTFEGFHVYEWAGHGVTLEVDDMLIPLKNAIAKKNAENDILDPTAADFELVATKVDVAVTADPDGAVNAKAVVGVNDDDQPIITYTGTETGKDVFYYAISANIKYGEKTPTLTAIVPVTVYSYDVEDNTYVLDYGLSVELNGDEFGMLVNDTLSLDEEVNPNTTVATFLGIGNAAVATDADGKPVTVTVKDPVFEKEYSKIVYAVSGDMAEVDEETGAATVAKTYGDFVYNVDEESVKYNPTDIIDNTDTIAAYVQVMEEDAEELTKFTGVVMYQFVTTAPATVVYYEENHPGITYVSEGENQWVHYETIDPETGESLAGTEQSDDQDQQYGYDENYAEDKVGTIVSGDSVGTVVDETTLSLDNITDLDVLQAVGIDYLNDYLGLGGSDSNGTVNELVVKETANVMFFEFVGTGFEIVGRTTDNVYAVINVQVQRKNDDGTYTIVRQKPVITESIGGDLYQVPIISITGLDKATYRVVVQAATTGKVARVLYIDGIRIYGPLDGDKALEYYNPEEYQAEFFEVKQLIQNGQAIFADASDSDNDFEMVTGTTLVEDQEANTVLTYIESPEEYMQIGPNNELYLDGVSTYGVIAFFLTPVEDYPDAARTLEIGAHRKTDSNEPDNKSNVNLVYGSDANQIIDAAEGDANFYSIGSGTEMYYTIDVANLTMKEGEDRYLVMIGTNGNTNEESYDALALTSIKVAGYEITFAQTAIQTAADEGTLDTLSIVQEPFSLLKARVATMEQEPEVEQIPVNENMTINSAALRADKVVSGKTAILTVKASAEAQTVVITDADGNVVDMSKCTRKVSGNVATFSINFKVTGSRGDALVYTIRVYDANGLASVNTETVTVTIK